MSEMCSRRQLGFDEYVSLGSAIKTQKGTGDKSCYKEFHIPIVTGIKLMC
jgi:hypothetical protein